MFDTLLVIVFVVVSAWWVLFLRVVPARKMGIIERLGLFDRVAFPGPQNVWWPIEYFREVTWTVPTQQGLRKETKTLVSFDNSQMDIQPIKCLTKDHIQATVDFTIFYSVTDIQKAVYHTDDIMNKFYQCINQILRVKVASLHAQNLRDGSAVVTFEASVNDINERMNDTGIKCNQVVLQGVDMDDRIEKANQEIYVKRQQAEMQREREEAEHKRKLAAIDCQKAQEAANMELEKKKQDLLSQQARAKAERERIEIQLDKERRMVVWNAYTEAGFTPQDIVELKKAEALSNATNKTVLAPLEYWTSRQRHIMTNEESIH